MTRFSRLKDWPASLERMSLTELEDEYAFWRRRERELGHPFARKGAANRARLVQKFIDSKKAPKAD
jgi:hypothetical protein